MSGNSPISSDDLFRAVLAMDVYHRGYNGGLGLADSGSIGNATIGRSSKTEPLIPQKQTSALLPCTDAMGHFRKISRPRLRRRRQLCRLLGS